MVRIVAALSLLAMVAFGQQENLINPSPTNVDFSDGEIGKIPPGWSVPPIVLHAGYTVERQREACPGVFSPCVIFRAPSWKTTIRAAELEQTFPAQPYLGKTIRFSAMLRAAGPGHGDVELRMRVDYAEGEVVFFDSVNPPVTAAVSQRREVVGHVNPGAITVSIWARFHPLGPAWASAPSFGIVDDSRLPAPNQSVRDTTNPVE